MADNFRSNPGDEEGRKFDPFSHSVTTIDENHRMIHDGFWFELFQEDVALLNGASVEVLLSVPAGTFPHFQELELDTDGGPVRVFLYENTVTSADGSELTWINKNRNSNNTPDTQVFVSPTITADGDLLKRKAAPNSGPLTVFNQSQGGEWVLAPSTKYLIRITNASGATREVNITIALYEIGYDQ